MRYFFLSLSVMLLGATAVMVAIGVYGAFLGSGSGIVSIVLLSLPLVTTVLAGVNALRRRPRFSYRTNLLCAIAALALAFLTANSLGAYYFTAGLIAVVTASVLRVERRVATRR